MHVYSVYGLGLHSEFAIPELLSCDGAAMDIVVRRVRPGPQSVRPPASASAEFEGESWAERDAERNETVCVFDGVGRYVIRGGESIDVEPAEGAEFGVVRHLLLGPVLAHLLWQRDLFTLHASVVEFGPRYAAFVGVSGEGKSTTAAALQANGHALVCDDVAALAIDADHLRVFPGFPRIRLYADSLRGVGDDPAALPRVHAHIDKRLKAVSRFVMAPVALHRLYVLGTGPAFSIEPLGPREALMEVLRHTYYAHQFAPLYGFETHLRQAARVVERVAAFRLTRPKDLARLPELIRLLDAHVAS